MLNNWNSHTHTNQRSTESSLLFICSQEELGSKLESDKKISFVFPIPDRNLTRRDDEYTSY